MKTQLHRSYLGISVEFHMCVLFSQCLWLHWAIRCFNPWLWSTCEQNTNYAYRLDVSIYKSILVYLCSNITWKWKIFEILSNLHFTTFAFKIFVTVFEFLKSICIKMYLAPCLITILLNSVYVCMTSFQFCSMFLLFSSSMFTSSSAISSNATKWLHTGKINCFLNPILKYPSISTT